MSTAKELNKLQATRAIDENEDVLSEAGVFGMFALFYLFKTSS